ncbi:hypothetical protein A7P54_15520 [Acinetobacter sp. Ac_3412]|uniref:hypothetical protein n=1 Tax=Acinetobacter sp. Ac_3412 TaxID=1848935 RepID=UPI001490059A|nr:hypothetical protein [Acinetobacter sp. Ac_3412]NNP77814.1 hypothetical protein [Acinetobacter sp. Ac_3412]
MLNTNHKEIKKVLLQSEKYETALRKRFNKKNNRAYYGSVAICFTLIGFSLFSIGIGFIFKNQFMMLVALIFIIFAELSLFLSTAIDMYNSRKGIISFFKNPLELLLQNTEFSTRSKIKFSPQLTDFELKDLKFTKREITLERDNFDKRTSIITGSIDKIGIFPTILATFILILTQLSNTNVQFFLNQNPNFKFYFFATIFIVFIFQILSLKNCFTILRLNTIIDTLDYIIEIKKEKV